MREVEGVDLTTTEARCKSLSAVLLSIGSSFACLVLCCVCVFLLIIGTDMIIFQISRYELGFDFVYNVVVGSSCVGIYTVV